MIDIADVKRDKIGMKFGRLTVIDVAKPYVSPRGEKSKQWLCKCECGNEIVVRGCMLTSGNTQSCGCLRKDVSAKRMYVHGCTHTRLYNIWKLIKSRCLNPNNRRFDRYGGRGITLCEEWMRYPPFRDWAIENGYDGELSIDRINNDDGYYPHNCRWANMFIQANNKSSNHLLCQGSNQHTMREWSDITGIPYSTLRSRVNSLNWSEDDALTTPIIDVRKRGDDGQYLPCDTKRCD